MPPSQNYCKTCGLFAPCPECGGGASKPRLAVVPSEPVYTEAQIRSAFERADAKTYDRHGGGYLGADDLIAALKEGGS